MIPDSVMERGDRAIALYQQIIAAGETARWAEMCALQSPPGVKNTDRTFCIGQREKMERMSPKVRKMLCKAAQKAGIQTDGKFYMGGLGGHTNPAAWVSCAEDVVTSCKVQNKGVEGVLNFAPPRPKEVEPPNVPLAESLINEMGHKYLKNDPALAEKCRKNPKARRELREKIIAKHGRPKKR